LNLSSDAPDGLDVSIGKLRPDDDGTRKVIDDIEEDTVHRISKADSE
jgi:hypothetical protein